MEYITKNALRDLLLLSKKKHRMEQGRTIIEGFRLIDEALQSSIVIEEVFFTEKSLNKLGGSVPEKFQPYQVTMIKPDDLARIADTENPQGIAAVIRVPVTHASLIAIKHETVLYLDRISDPGNLGTIFRTAQWFGIKDVILSEDCADAYNAKVIRSSMGAVFFLNFYRDPAGRALNMLKEQGYTAIAAHLTGNPVYQLSRGTNKTVAVIGSEAHGVHENLLSQCDQCIVIPQYGGGESLNAAVSAGILLAFLTRPQ